VFLAAGQEMTVFGRARCWSIICVLVAASAPVAVADPGPFPRPASLRENVEFWTHVFATYSRHQIVIHDAARPGRLYSILDFRREAAVLSDNELWRLKQNAEAAELRRIRGILEKLHHHPESAQLSVEEMRIRSLLVDDPHPDRFRRAADPKRLRSQTGIRERFLEGVQRSHRYLPRMERIFRSENVPIELTRLPLVESSFNTHAYSKVGAAGMWQFMPATGKIFMKIDPAVDERLDPFVATRAAARFLRQNYERLGTWPLAITAYNHGPGGMARAVRETGTTDIGEIVRRYDGPSFGFASRNFYAEFLAALDVHRDYRAHFGDIPLDAELDVDEVVLTHFVPLGAVQRCAGVDLGELKALNPAVRPAAYSGSRWLPSGYGVRLPRHSTRSFLDCYASLPASAKQHRHPATERYHTVRRGETLSTIARRYGTSTSGVQRANGLRTANLIRVGQRLKIPGSATAAAPLAAASHHAPQQKSTPRVHRVRRGQTLVQIARLYGTSVDSIRRANDLRSADHIRAGQSLKIPR
jgi:membrane-bound lytic murein transglycosylase D